MEINKNFINHYQVSRVGEVKLREQVGINKEYLKEKPTWYIIDDTLQYFKVRNDYRLLTESFCSKLGKVMGLDTLEYRVAYLKDTAVYLPKSEQQVKCGLLSNSFQTKDKNYYLVSELLNSEISDLRSYGEYSLQNLLSFLEFHTTKECYEKNKSYLLLLFICDYFTHQLDRNYHNISFEIPKIEGVNYKERLRLNVFHSELASKYGVYSENGMVWKIPDLFPTKMYDSERSLGADHKKPLSYANGEVWMPLFPYSRDLLFSTQEEGQAKKEEYDGLDPNLVEVALNYDQEVIPILERLVYGDEYREVLEQYNTNHSQIRIKKETNDFLVNLFEDKQKEMKKVLSLFK